MPAKPMTGLGRIVNEIEETLIAIILGLMTLITFANVVARYVFNSNILWALESTVFLFAWLGLLGASYLVKVTGHLGVDVVVRLIPQPTRRMVTLAAASVCLVYALLLTIGAWTYWWPFISNQVWYEVNDIVIPNWLRFIEPLLNEGEPYEKLPRFIPYFALPLGMSLLLFRLAQATWAVWTGRSGLMIASHEAEDLLEEAAQSKTGA